MNIALLGCGRIGQMHASHIMQRSDCVLTMVYDPYMPSATALAEKGKCYVASKEDEVFSSQEVDAVLIASQTDTHADYIEKCVFHQKPVLCEKPIDLDLKRVQLCQERIEGSSVPIQLGFNRRFDPTHRAVFDALQAGDIGSLHQIIITSRDPEMPSYHYYKQAGGLFCDMTIHDFDMARFLLGGTPNRVFANAARLNDPKMMAELDDYDSCMIILQHEDGRQCHINNSRAAVYGYDQRIELMGHKGMLQSENKRNHEMRYFNAESSDIQTKLNFFFMDRYRQSFYHELSHFIEAVRTHTQPSPNFEDGRQALILAYAAYKSLKEARMVHINEIVAF